MSKAFTKESGQDDEDQDTGAPARPADAALGNLSAAAGGTTARYPQTAASAGNVSAGPAKVKNYITPAGYKRLKDEALNLLDKERPELVKVVQWAASNGDRSENADYIYGKRRLREIDRRIRFLTKRLDAAVVVDPASREASDQVFFGATVTVANGAGEEKTYSIVGIDEADVSRGRISWISPLAKALIKAHEGDSVTVRTPAGDETLEIVKVQYQAID
ncbi:MAG TPA: transcription elongation factor GreB [Burkholderiales bacterium]|jgi:transcription elongation factor GreB|nr:transcription elongation factor GreB [Burkholderiales bacterium]